MTDIQRTDRLSLRNDILLLLTLAGFSALMLTARAVYAGSGADSAARVVIIKDGETIGEYRLDDDREFIVGSEDGEYNRIKISGGACSVTDASCPDGLCIKRGEISARGEAAICLPNRLSVEVRGGDDAEEPDVISR